MLLTQYDQLLLLEMGKNKGSITKEVQKTFDCKFYNSVSKLIDLGLVGYRLDKKDKRKKIYFLKDAGIFFVMVLIGNEKDKTYLLIFLSDKILDPIDNKNKKSQSK